MIMYFMANLLLLLLLLYADCGYAQVDFDEELQSLNISCNPIFDCMQVGEKGDNSPTISRLKPCSCHTMCPQFNTCCLDAPISNLKQAKAKSSCRRVKLSEFYFETYFMVDRCSYDGNSDSAWKNLCNDEIEAEDDLMRLVPVTSLITSMTYKNYFCLRCHETTDDYVSWNVQLKSDSYENLPRDMKHDKLQYSWRDKTWMVRLENSEIWLPVNLHLQIPTEINNYQVYCIPNIISRCSSEWSDDVIQQECHSYSSLIEISKGWRTLIYRNPHCAFCNFESLSKMRCGNEYGYGGYGGGAGGSYGGGHGYGYAHEISGDRKILFSFTHLLDINRSDGDKVGKIKKCEDSSLWDPWAKTCRKLSCAIPGYTVQGRECVPP